jgi:prepilin-type N-terminal cleavage/methylation domain-containing protein
LCRNVFEPLKHSTVRRTAVTSRVAAIIPSKLRIVDTMKEYQSTLKNLLLPRVPRRDSAEAGFTLMETLVALVILTFGLLAAGQMMFVAMGSNSLSRSKGSAVTVAQDRLEFLADLYRQNPANADLTLGTHTFLASSGQTGPVPVEIKNPNDNTTVNRFSVVWSVCLVPDSRKVDPASLATCPIADPCNPPVPNPCRVLAARQVRVTATPIATASTATNRKAGLNKVVNVSAIFSPRLTS